MNSVRIKALLVSASASLLFWAGLAAAQQVPLRARQFPPGSLRTINELPPGRFRTKVEGLPPAARQRSLEWLQTFHFTELDLQSLEVDASGGVYYADSFSINPAPAQNSAPKPPLAQEASTPIPASLIFHSKRGSENVIFLNFSGEKVTNTIWNMTLGRSVIPALPFSIDTNYTSFTDVEQIAIKRIWQRVAEDYCPFDVDVTTERPPAFGPRIAHALITRSKDANGDPNPSPTGGGVGYVNVFGLAGYDTYRPSWIYCDNLLGNDSYIGEAVSHEMGHNFGLSHDGRLDGSEYYGGHGSGNISWGPIMGSSYNRNVSQWSKGDYYLANNSEDDLAIIGGKLSFREDDHGDTLETATPLVITDGANVVSTTPENDPNSTNPANKGILERNTDVDVFWFETGNGAVSLTVSSWLMATGTRGGNLDLLLELRDEGGTLLLTNNPATDTIAQIQTNLSEGVYFLLVRNCGAGNPMSSTPSGYTPYASIGQYFINGYVAGSGDEASGVRLIATVNHPGWGTVIPTNGTYLAGAEAAVTATPATYFRFLEWTNDVTGTNDPLTVIVNQDLSVQAVFTELLTSGHPTPYWWLASFGYTNNFETAASALGTNGMTLWQSYVGGLSPTDPRSQLRVSFNRDGNGADILHWEPVTGRVYTVWSSTNLAGGFQPLPGAIDLPPNVRFFTNSMTPKTPGAFYLLEVKKP